MARVWLERTLTGFRAADDDAKAVLAKFKPGTTFEADVITREKRSLAWHRRYWLLMSMLSENVESVDLGNGALMPIHDAEDMHTAIKLLTGHCWTYTTDVGNQRHIVRIPKPTNFREMKPEEWPKYWKSVLDAIHWHVLPGVNEYVEEELARMAS